GSIAMGASNGKIALVSNTTAITGKSDPDVVDFVGYGTANEYEGSGATGALSNTTSAERKASSTSTTTTMGIGGTEETAGNGYDSNNNSADFTIRTGPQPQNSASATEPASSAGDIIPPTILSVKSLSSTQIEIVFNEAVDSLTSTADTNYTLNKSVVVSLAQRDAANWSRVVLGVSTMVPDVYTLTVANVKDTAGNVMPTPKNVQFAFGTLTMAQARAAGAGAMVRVRGTVTVGNEFKSPSFMQDSTGGMGVYNSQFSTNAKVGDVWEVTGSIQDYYGLFEINPLTDSVRVSTGNLPPVPNIITSAQMGEAYEAQLVRINRVKFVLTGNFGSSAADSGYSAADASGSFTVYIDKDSNIPGSAIPTDSVNIVGVLTQFHSTYQLQPRSIADIGVVDPQPGQTWTDINVARTYGAGTPVRIRGIVTFDQPSATSARTIYLQDKTAGIALYDPRTDTLHIGDSVEVHGQIADFNGLAELKTIDTLVIFGKGLPLPAPKILTLPQVSETYESQLITIHDVQFIQSGTFPVTAVTFQISDGANQLDVRIPANSLLANQTIPVGALDIVGVLGQYMTNFQLTPRSPADLISLPGPQIVTQPTITNLSGVGFTVNWTTLIEGNSVLYFGRTQALGDSLVDSTLATNHSFAITGLTPGRIYYYRAVSANLSGVSSGSITPVVTTSPASSGEMDVYFNYSTDGTLGLLPAANGSTALMDKLLTRISLATKTIDMALYSFDDFGGNPAVVANRVADSLVSAKNRGVAVRMVFDNKATSTPLSKLITAGISVIKRTVPGTDQGIMHNKFFVFDGRDTTSATDDWVVTGSWNVTNDGTVEDAQNALFIQDQSLARIYELEFEEMFGSSLLTANPSSARFGPNKQDNTPHYTYVGGTKVEVYFSPSDQTTSHIIGALSSADNNVFFGVLSFTRDDIASTLIARKNAGAIVRGMIDQQPSTLGSLQLGGVDALQAGHSVVTGLFHHKYAIVDPFNDGSDPLVITGSHNWSGAAENDNDENTLIIHSGDIARQYVQEFSKRYQESGGSGAILGVERAGDLIPRTSSLLQNYPNPFNPSTNLEVRVATHGLVSVRVFDVLGREIATLMNEIKAPGVYRLNWDASRLASGMYLCKMQTGTFNSTKKMLLVR
ncbi:MAG TPA: phospholipase D-like domain-containing protein, partial [Bacteroidota bacterium]